MRRGGTASLLRREHPHLLIVFRKKLDLANGIPRNGIFKAIEKNLQARQFAINRSGP